MSKKILVWFRNDLRLHDNEMLVEAVAKSEGILPVYCFDPRQFIKTPLFSLKTGVHRAQFLIENVAALRDAFQKMGGNLLLRIGKPEDILPALVSQYHIDEVYHHREVAAEETAVSTQVEDQLWKLKVNLKHFIGHTLYNKEDLPFPVRDIPNAFNQFRKKTERDALVKPCFPQPQQISFLNADDWGGVPSLQTLFADTKLLSPKLRPDFKGGEAEALIHLENFINDSEKLALEAVPLKKQEAVSKLSAWLAIGSLSPREVYWKLKEAEIHKTLKPYFSHVILGLLWRDYFRFMFKKYGNTFFRQEGFKQELNSSALRHTKILQKWKNGETGQIVIDAIMQELNTTGYIAHDARLLTASYLVSKLRQSWVLGAAYFEEQLIDYCPASNWGNWANVAGVGSDQRLNVSFDFEKQLKAFDAKAIYTHPVKAD